MSIFFLTSINASPCKFLYIAWKKLKLCEEKIKTTPSSFSKWVQP